MRAIRTVFLDRDGVINRKCPEGDYVKSWSEFEFLPGAKEALMLLKRLGLRVIVVTNQRGIARGLFTKKALHEIHARMQAELQAADATVDAIYYCPHDEGQCDCRKPQTGLFLQAQRDFSEIDFAGSLIIGDSLSDLEAGARLGCHGIVIADAKNRDALIADARARSIALDGTAPSLLEAVTQYLLVAPSSSKISPSLL